MGLNENVVASDPSLDAANIDVTALPECDAPLRGGERRPGFQAVFRRAALEQIHRHGKETTAVEICGVLVGNVYRDASGAWLYVESVIRGDAAEGHAAQVTFKAETWDHIQREMDAKYPDKRIVGWYHTHPGFGVFLSGMDLFIQDNFFNLPWQVAFVYDPVGGDEASFVWRAGKCEREPFVIDEVVSTEESWDLARDSARRNCATAAAEAASAVPSEGLVQRFGRWLGRSKVVVATVVAFTVGFVLAGLGFALFAGA